MQEALFAEEPTFTVAELNSDIGAVLGRAFPDELWVRGEIANLSRPPSGHVYFDLVDGDCALSVTLWASDRQVVNAVLRRSGGAVRMTDGTEVRIRVRVSWYAKRGQVSLRMLSIDTAYTLGRLAEARELLLMRLKAEGLLARQPALSLAPVPLTVGLITSDNSAAAHDFLQTLEASGFAWKVVLVDARVQGLEAEASVLDALDRLLGLADPVDVVCIVRGGGARTDLAAFDSEAIARAIAACSRFRSSRASATRSTRRWPTWSRTDAASRRPRARVRSSSASASGARVCTTGAGRSRVPRSAPSTRPTIDRLAVQLAQRAPRSLDRATRLVDHVETRVRALDPARVLARGWSITRDEHGRLVRSTGDVVPGTALVTTVADGVVRSTVDG